MAAGRRPRHPLAGAARSQGGGGANGASRAEASRRDGLGRAAARAARRGRPLGGRHLHSQVDLDHLHHGAVAQPGTGGGPSAGHASVPGAARHRLLARWRHQLLAPLAPAQRDVRQRHAAGGAVLVWNGRSAGGPVGGARRRAADVRRRLELPRHAGIWRRDPRVVSHHDIGAGRAAGIRAVPENRRGSRGPGARPRVPAGAPAVPVATGPATSCSTR